MRRRGATPKPDGAAVVRCAIYTRKSSEEGLEQEFNSLDAQREACEAYILSQKGAGWVALSALYDDGGHLRRHDGAAFASAHAGGHRGRSDRYGGGL